MQYECKADGEMPKEFLEAVKKGAEVQVNTYSVLGWLTVLGSDLEYRNGTEYRIKPS
jgi:hypothetical protein